MRSRHEGRKLAAEILKLRLEARAMRYQQHPRVRRLENLKSIANLTGLVTAALAIVAFVASSAQWLTQQQDAREERESARLERALVMLSENLAGKRISATIVLGTFVAAKDARQQRLALQALANALPVEEDPFVRAALLDAVRNLTKSRLPGELLHETFQSLVRANRTLVLEGNLVNNAGFPQWLYERDTTIQPLERRAGATGEAIAALIGAGVRTKDLSMIYCAECDFSERNLDDVKFDGSVLIAAKFVRSSLVNASFAGTNLNRADFRWSAARGATFSDNRKPATPQTFPSFFARVTRMPAAARTSDIIITGPDFGCSDLSYAIFHEFPIGTFVENLHKVRFVGANLVGTNFQKAAIIESGGGGLPFVGTGTYSGSHHFGVVYDLIPNPRPHRHDAEQLRKLEEAFADLFRGSSWQSATFPAVLRQILLQRLGFEPSLNVGRDKACDKQFD